MKIIVIGHRMVGHKLVECLAQDAAHGLDITVLSEESRPAHDRVHLTDFFAGKTADDLSLVEPGGCERHNGGRARCSRTSSSTQSNFKRRNRMASSVRI
jgi:nitrite reductase (NADH) large subunit